jgi:hypothetical protein
MLLTDIKVNALEILGLVAEANEIRMQDLTNLYPDHLSMMIAYIDGRGDDLFAFMLSGLATYGYYAQGDLPDREGLIKFLETCNKLIGYMHVPLNSDKRHELSSRLAFVVVVRSILHQELILSHVPERAELSDYLGLANVDYSPLKVLEQYRQYLVHPVTRQCES